MPDPAPRLGESLCDSAGIPPSPKASSFLWSSLPGPHRPRQTTAITQDSFSWSLSLSELSLRHAQDPPGPGVLNKRDEPQPISRSLLDGKRYFLHGSAKIDRAYLF